MKILFLGETYRADAQTWIRGIEEASGFKIDTDEIRTIRFKPIRAIQAFLFIGRLIRGRFFGKKYDIVLAERSTSYGFFSLFTNAKVKVVAQQGISDVFPNTFFSSGYKKLLQRIVYKNVDLIHAWGNAMVPAMLRSGAVPNNILVMPKGIDLSLFEFRNNFESTAQTEINAVVTRSLFPEYNHSIIIESIAQLRNIGVIVNLKVVGGGPLLNQLKKQVDERELNNQIQFLGRVSNDLLPNILTKSQLYISVPITEGASASLMEAMASGCYPIVTDLPGNRSFIKNRVNGHLVEVGNPVDLADAIISYISIPEQQLQKTLLTNRREVEINIDRKKNMEFFFRKYVEILNEKQNY